MVTPFILHNFWIVVIAGMVMVMLYKPPGQFGFLTSFVERHFGDSLGLYILHLGIGLVLLGGFYAQVKDVGQVGLSLIMASLVALKLKTVPGNGNGNGDGGPTERTITETQSTTVSVGSPPVAAAPVRH